MPARGPRIVLIGRSFLALCVLERLLERGETVAAFVGQEGGSERDFCEEIHEVCSRHSIPARSARKLGEEAVRWLEDRIRPELAINVGASFDIPLASGGNSRLGLVELSDSGCAELPRRVALRQRGRDVVSRTLPESPAHDEAENEDLLAVDALLDLLESHLDGLRGPGAVSDISYHGAALGEEQLQLASADPTPGAHTDELERVLAGYVEAGTGLAVNSVSGAFEALFAELGLGPGDEVVCPAIVSQAAVNAVRTVGAQPVFADVQSGCLTLDPERLADVITPRKRALLFSHPWCQPAELDALYGAASETGLEVVEDASAALGARFEHSRIGRSPCAAVFRMPLAPLSPGAAPALLALPEELGARVRRRLQRERIGDGAATLATARLEDWDAELSARRQVAAHYSSELIRYDAFLVPSTPDGRLPSYAGYVLRLTRFSRTSAEDLHKLMAGSGIETRMFQLGVEAGALTDLAVADRVRGDALLLPCHAQLDSSAIDGVLDALFGYAIG